MRHPRRRDAQFVSQHGPEEGHVDQSAAELLCDEATSTPEAPSLRSLRQPVAPTVFSKRTTRSASSRSATDAGPRSADELGRGVAQLLVAQRSDERP